MTGPTIVELDPFAQDARSLALFQGWVEASTETHRAEFGERHTAYTADELRERLRLLSTQSETMLAVVVPGQDGAEQVVAEGRVRLPLLDNLRFAALFLSVRPDWRRQGIGSALLADLERRARAEGRTVLCMESDLAIGDDKPAYAFAPKHGYQAALVNLRSDLDLPAGDLGQVLDGLEADAVRHAADYDVLTWWDDVPDEWLEQRAVLATRMSTDAPMGDVDVEEEVWDGERVRETFRIAAGMGRRVVETVAVHRATGQAVAFTDLAVASHSPASAYQWDTLVLSEHRGRRLGQLVKAVNLRALRAELPGVERVVTWNAESNGPMLRVNREMGFAPIGVNTEWQKTVG